MRNICADMAPEKRIEVIYWTKRCQQLLQLHIRGEHKDGRVGGCPGCFSPGPRGDYMPEKVSA